MLARFPRLLPLRARLHLCIASGHVRLDLLQPLRSTSVRMTGRMLWAYLRGQDQMYYRVVGSETVTSTINAHTLQATVQQALQQLERNSHKKLAGCALTVEVGPALARVGLLELDGAGHSRLASADLQAYAHAWVSHTWGLEPADFVIRCHPLPQGHKYVLVCVDTVVPTLLEQLCQQQGLHFSDCTPALVLALSRLPVQTAPSVLVLMESTPGPRIAQLVAMDASGPLSVARVWLGNAATVTTTTTTTTVQDDEVTPMVRRLCAQHQLQEPVHIHRPTWPAPVDGTPRGASL